MDRKYLIAIIAIILILAVGAGVWFFLAGRTAPGDDGGDQGGFNPFGFLGGGGSDTGGSFTGGGGNTANGGAGGNVGTGERGPLEQLVATPVSGFVVFEKEVFVGTSTEATRTVPTLRYVERQSGNIFEIDLEANERTRLSNTTVPRVHEAFFTPDGTRAILRYLAEDNQTIETFSGELISGTPEENDGFGYIEGTFFPQNIPEIAVGPSGEQVFYLQESGGGVLGILATLDGTEREQVFSSPFSEWRIAWINDGTIALTTKPAGNFPGYAYTLDISSGDISRIVGGDGLTTLPQINSDFILYGEGHQGDLNLAALRTGTEEQLSLPLNTLPEKCVWSTETPEVYCGIPFNLPNEPLPDAWYRGQISFSDSLWRINTETGFTDFLGVFSGEDIDFIKPTLSPDETRVYFINKKDLSLWSFAFEDETPSSTEGSEE